MAQNVIKGKKLMVFIKKENTYKSIALSTNHTLTLSASTSDLAVRSKDQAKGKSWTDSEINEMSWSVSSESLVGTNEGHGWGDIMDLYLKGEKVELVFDGVTSDGAPVGGFSPAASGDDFQGLKGTALITSLTLNAPLEDNGTYTVEFSGTGPLEKYTA